MNLTAYRTLIYVCGVLALFSIALCFALWDMPIRGLVFFPLAYICFLFLTSMSSWHTGPSLFLAVCHITAFLRYVALPALIAFDGGYEGRSWIEPAAASYAWAAVVMCFEVFVVGLAITWWERRYHRRKKAAVLADRLRVVPTWYFASLVVLALGLIALMPQSLLLINIGRPTILIDEENFPPFASLAGMVLISTKVFFFLRVSLALSRISRLRTLSPWLAAIVCLANVGIYFGSNRMAIVLATAASVVVLYQLFGRRVMPAIAGILAAVVLLFAAVTAERQYATISESSLTSSADMIQSYVGGIYNVAIGLEVPEYYPEAGRPIVFLYDVLRPTVGFNLLVRDWPINYSNVYFNNRMFTHVDRRSQIIPMVAQAALFLPLLLAPLLSVAVVGCAYLLMRAADRTQVLELRYAFYIMAMRLGFFWGQNTMNMMNYFSLNVIIPCLLILGFLILRRFYSPRYAEFPRNS